MTVLVGILCSDGVVIGSDSSSTFVHGPTPTIEQKIKKIHVVGEDVMIAGTGQVGLGQRFGAIVAADRRSDPFPKRDPIAVCRQVAQKTIEDFASTHVDKGQFGSLMAFISKDSFSLCEFSTKDFQPELKNDNLWYVSMGSGQPITDPFLGFIRRVFWKNSMPNVTEAIFAVAWALEHTIELNPGGINGPPQIGVLSKVNNQVKARLLTDGELAEHGDNVRGAEKHLAVYRSLQAGAGAQPIPAPP